MGVSRTPGVSSESTITGIEFVAERLGNLRADCDDKSATHITSPVAQVSDKDETAMKKNLQQEHVVILATYNLTSLRTPCLARL